MTTIGNIIWILCGGLMVAVEYFLGGLALCLTIIGIPFGIQQLKLGLLCLCPFGTEVRNRENYGCLAAIMNIIWFFIGGWVICLTHLFWGLLLCVTIIGIPFGKQHFKMVELGLLPFTKKIVDV